MQIQFNSNSLLSPTFREVTQVNTKWLVVKGTAVVEGVLKGFYLPMQEFSASTSAWNGVPLVIRHPQKNGGSARVPNPDVPVVGKFMSAGVDPSNRRMTGEFWLDANELLKTPEGKLIDFSVRNGMPVEVSTGYYAVVDPKTGAYKGTSFKGIHRNLQPDHVALLPDQVGACSIKDGCGMNRNTAEIFHNAGCAACQLEAGMSAWLNASYVPDGKGGVKKAPGYKSGTLTDAMDASKGKGRGNWGHEGVKGQRGGSKDRNMPAESIQPVNQQYIRDALKAEETAMLDFTNPQSATVKPPYTRTDAVAHFDRVKKLQAAQRESYRYHPPGEHIADKVDNVLLEYPVITYPFESRKAYKLSKADKPNEYVTFLDTPAKGYLETLLYYQKQKTSTIKNDAGIVAGVMAWLNVRGHSRPTRRSGRDDTPYARRRRTISGATIPRRTSHTITTSTPPPPVHPTQPKLTFDPKNAIAKGGTGKGKGNWGHKGVPGHRGGSADRNIPEEYRGYEIPAGASQSLKEVDALTSVHYNPEGWDFYKERAGLTGDETLESFALSTYSYSDEKTGLQAKLSRVEIDGAGAITMEGTIFTKEGRDVGNYTRTMNINTGEVHNDLFEINEEWRGDGFGGRFYAHAEESLIKHKAKKITVMANISVGGYAWSRMGFDFDPEKQGGRNAWTRVRLLDAAREEWKAQFPKAKYPSMLMKKNYSKTHTWDLAALQGPKAEPFGKGFLTGETWYGVKYLNPQDTGFQVGETYYELKGYKKKKVKNG